MNTKQFQEKCTKHESTWRPIQLLGDRILARLIEETHSAGGLHLPESAQMTQPCRRAEIVNCGPGTKQSPMEVKIGDRVLLDFRGGFVDIGGERLIVTNAPSVLGVEVTE